MTGYFKQIISIFSSTMLDKFNLRVIFSLRFTRRSFQNHGGQFTQVLQPWETVYPGSPTMGDSLPRFSNHGGQFTQVLQPWGTVYPGSPTMGDSLPRFSNHGGQFTQVLQPWGKFTQVLQPWGTVYPGSPTMGDSLPRFSNHGGQFTQVLQPWGTVYNDFYLKFARLFEMLYLRRFSFRARNSRGLGRVHIYGDVGCKHKTRKYLSLRGLLIILKSRYIVK